jgi:hypothetical protein
MEKERATGHPPTRFVGRNILCCNKEIKMSADVHKTGPMKLEPEDLDLPTDVQDKLLATAAARKPDRTLIDALSEKGGPAREDGNIVVGTLRD